METLYHFGLVALAISVVLAVLVNIPSVMRRIFYTAKQDTQEKAEHH